MICGLNQSINKIGRANRLANTRLSTCAAGSLLTPRLNGMAVYNHRCEECSNSFRSTNSFDPYCREECRKAGHARLTLAFSTPPTFRSSRHPASQRYQPPIPRGVKPQVAKEVRDGIAARSRHRTSVQEGWQRLSEEPEIYSRDVLDTTPFMKGGK